MTIITSWDDGCNHDVRLSQLLEKYNLPAIFYIPSKWIDYGYMKGYVPLTEDQLLDISSKFEIGAHGRTHALLTKISLDAAEIEIVRGKEEMEDFIDKDITSFCYPRGYANDPIKNIVRKHFDTARNTLVGSIEEDEDPIWQSTSVHVCADRDKYLGDNWLDYGLKLLKQAKRRKDSVFHIWGHSWEIDHKDGWRGLELLFAEATS